MMSDNKENYFASAKEALREGLQSDDTNLKLTKEQIKALYNSHPGRREKSDAWANFNAEYLNFLRPVVQSEVSTGFTRDGVNILPHAEGGITLSATNGAVTLLALDPSGSCHPDGIRFSVPGEAFDACVPPKLFKLQWEGQFSDVEKSVPDYAVPAYVAANGTCLIVMPKGQPEGTEEGYGGALFSCLHSSVYGWSDREYTVGKPWEWAGSADLWLNSSEMKLGTGGIQEHIAITPFTSDIIAQATQYAPDSVWEIKRMPGNIIALIPSGRDDLIIFVAMARLENSLSIPSWVGRVKP